MSSSLASFVAQRKDSGAAMLKAKQFEFDAEGIRMAAALSLRDWREWWPMAVPPFEQTWLEWSPDDYVTAPIVSGDRRFDRVGILFTHAAVEVSRQDREETETLLFQAMSGKLFYAYKRAAHEVPFTMIFNSTPEYLEEQSRHGRDYIRSAWGGPYCDKFGPPPMLVMMPSVWSKSEPLKASSAIHAFVGCPRVAMACLALLNTEKTRQAYPENYVAGRTIGEKGNSIPQHKPRVIVLRPDAIRYVMENVEREPTGIRRKEHDVRAHVMTIGRGPRKGQKILRAAHKRGDASLGRVESSYRVSRAPPVIED